MKENIDPEAIPECKCGSPGEPDHTCPYSEEICASYETCNCCRACTQECAWDI